MKKYFFLIYACMLMWSNLGEATHPFTINAGTQEEKSFYGLSYIVKGRNVYPYTISEKTDVKSLSAGPNYDYNYRGEDFIGKEFFPTCYLWKNLNTLDIQNFDFEERFINMINKISSLKTIKLNIDDFDLLLKTFKTLDSVEEIILYSEKHSYRKNFCYKVEKMPENFKKQISKLNYHMSDLISYPTILTDKSLPEFSIAQENLARDEKIKVNSLPEYEVCYFLRNGNISKNSYLERCFYIEYMEKETQLYALYYPNEGNEFNIYFHLLSEDKSIPFKYAEYKDGYTIFIRKN